MLILSLPVQKNLLQTNSECFGCYMSQITHICGPDTTWECQFVASSADPPHHFIEGETEPFQRWSVSLNVTQLVTSSAGTETLSCHDGCIFLMYQSQALKILPCPKQGWANSSFWSKCGQLLAFVNKVLLRYSQVHVFADGLWLPSHYKDGAESLGQRPYGIQS